MFFEYGYFRKEPFPVYIYFALLSVDQSFSVIRFAVCVDISVFDIILVCDKLTLLFDLYVF